MNWSEIDIWWAIHAPSTEITGRLLLELFNNCKCSMANLFYIRKDSKLTFIQLPTRPTFSSKKLNTKSKHTSRKQVRFKAKFQRHRQLIDNSVSGFETQDDVNRSINVDKVEKSVLIARDGRVLNSNKWQIPFTLQHEDGYIILTIKIAKQCLFFHFSYLPIKFINSLKLYILFLDGLNQ